MTYTNYLLYYYSVLFGFFFFFNNVLLLLSDKNKDFKKQKEKNLTCNIVEIVVYKWNRSLVIVF